MIPNDSSIGKIIYDLVALLPSNSRNQTSRKKFPGKGPTLRNEGERIWRGRRKKRRKEEDRLTGIQKINPQDTHFSPIWFQDGRQIKIFG
jgi:hypothetical protein